MPAKPNADRREAIAREVNKLWEEHDQQWVADLLGVSQSTVSNLAAGKSSASIGTAIALRDALRMPLEELLDIPPVAGGSGVASALRTVAALAGIRVEVLDNAAPAEDRDALAKAGKKLEDRNAKRSSLDAGKKQRRPRRPR